MLEEREMEKDIGESWDTTLKLPNAKRQGGDSTRPEKKPDLNRKGSLGKLA